MGKRVAVVGASGFVGAALVEQSLQDGDVEVVPIIHSAGSAWRLIRHGLQVQVADLLNKESVQSALRGCTHVVNCSRGGSDVMLAGLRNLLSVAAELRLNGFLHLSSVMIYGDPPSPDSVSETGTIPRQRKTNYGGLKLQQDKMVQRAAAAGLPSLILCPPNISGPYSYFLGAIVTSLRTGTLGIVEEGKAACNLVDVANLAHAIILGLDHCSQHSERLFITDDADVTWGQVVASLMPLCDGNGSLAKIDREELVRLRNELADKPKINPISSLMHLVSSDVRAALRKDPLWARLDGAMRQGVAKLGAVFEDKIRLAVEGPIQIAKAPTARNINVPLSAQQLRGVRHSCERAKEAIGYRPRYSFADSMQAYCAWYRSHTGQNSPAWTLARYLWQ